MLGPGDLLASRVERASHTSASVISIWLQTIVGVHVERGHWTESVKVELKKVLNISLFFSRSDS